MVCFGCDRPADAREQRLGQQWCSACALELRIGERVAVIRGLSVLDAVKRPSGEIELVCAARPPAPSRRKIDHESAREPCKYN